MAKQPDILIFMSDQHGADYTGWGSVPVDTPNLDDMRANGTSFDSAYTACPLCVPARMSMMSGKVPSELGIFGNNDTLLDMTPCFTHPLVEAGYETVLIGRMHFIGRDQRHGFTKRLAPDLTPVTWKRPFKKLMEERGDLQFTTFDVGATDIVGGGESFVEHYDRMVVDVALEYLSQSHEKPQFILVGTYGPRSPYITDPILYQKYFNRVQLPAHFDPGDLPDYMNQIPELHGRVRGEDVEELGARGCLAAYLGQIERMDSQIGELRRALAAYAEKTNRETVMGYISDHGDTAGERRIYGKRTFFDKAAKVPMMFEGIGIPPNNVVTSPVSLLDLGPTICAIAGTEFDLGEGKDLTPFFYDCTYVEEDRIVVSQYADRFDRGVEASAMLRWNNFKYIRFHDEKGSRLLFDLKADPIESADLSADRPELVEWFEERLNERMSFEQMERLYVEHERNSAWFRVYEEQTCSDDSERWNGNPPTARGDLEIKTVYRVRKPPMRRVP